LIFCGEQNNSSTKQLNKVIGIKTWKDFEWNLLINFLLRPTMITVIVLIPNVALI